MWFVFPQLRAVAAGETSFNSQYFAFPTVEHAQEFANEESVMRNYTAAVEHVYAHLVDLKKRPETIFESDADIQKLISSLTLFEMIGDNNITFKARKILAAIGRPRCPYTVAALKKAAGDLNE